MNDRSIHIEHVDLVRDTFARQFADKALTILLSRTTFVSVSAIEEISEGAYAYADAMMAERAKRVGRTDVAEGPPA